MDTPLVDTSGYPRTDIDLYSVRTTRGNIRKLLNDYKAVTLQIEAELPSALARVTPKKHFARVNGVLENSPAQLAGICSGDLLIQFGSITVGTFKSLSSLAGEITNGQIAIRIERGDSVLAFDITIPAGQSLGMHLL